MIRSEQALSKSTSHGSTIHDCGEPFKLRSTLSEDRVLPPPSTNASFSGQACEADPGFRAPARHKLPTFAICATAIESRCQAYFSRYSGPGRRIEVPRADIAIQSQPFRRNRQ
jgi:hypothetical protein